MRDDPRPEQRLSPSQHVSRRRLIQGIGAGATVMLAGCAEENGNGATEQTPDDDDETGTEPDDGEEELTAAAYAFTDTAVVGLDTETEATAEVESVPNASWEDVIATPEYLFAVENGSSEVYVLDPGTDEITDRIPVGTNPVHGFYAESTDEVWVHSDDEAQFYVVDAAAPDSVEARVAVGDVGAGHGKVAATGDGRAVVTNMEAGGLFVVNLEAKETTEHIEFDADYHSHSHSGHQTLELLHDAGDDHDHDDDDHDHDDDDHDHSDGTHYVAYAPESGLAFVEELGGGHHQHSMSGSKETQRLTARGVSPLHGDDDGGDARTVVVDVDNAEVEGTIDAGGPTYGADAHELVSVIDGDDVHFVDSTDSHGHADETVTLSDASPAAVRFGADGAYTANPHSGDISILDIESYEELERLSVPGDHLDDMPSVIADETFATVAADTAVLVDLESQDPVQFDVSDIQTVGLLSAGAVTN
ncbi:WD40/YVTN domain protein [Natronomonas pharaonis DSM 2160]|uniref:WD40/YVTN domain protein n=1 Tax=Natronomonas pharaonis (strain ATCC 35678 / DSM 2160 / CIP 103997 / JCM 8858 / NBRC 14720 / NCIMB 2260 / Gabara) TaxID=348780 RepID=A0A1U7EYR8_NATPD|nr:hypothetical protein [Natronomonas pharaonis]CAI50395.1 WD40/YVTN domain protein [Natronomonas pharaonis DSM 2160]